MKICPAWETTPKRSLDSGSPVRAQCENMVRSRCLSCSVKTVICQVPCRGNLLSVRSLIADDLVHNVIKLVRIIKISHDIRAQVCGIGGSITVGNADCH